MNYKGFIGSFAISALLVSAAVALLIVTGAMLAFDGFPGPSVDDPPKGVHAVILTTGAHPKPELVLEPPSASALDQSAGAEGADAGEAAAGALAATAGSPATPAGATTETAVPPVVAPAPPTDPTPPALPGGGAADDPTDAIESSVDGLAPVTDGVDDLVGGVNRGVQRP